MRWSTTIRISINYSIKSLLLFSIYFHLYLCLYMLLVMNYQSKNFSSAEILTWHSYFHKQAENAMDFTWSLKIIITWSPKVL